MLFIALIIFTGNICEFARTSPTELEFSRNVKNCVEKINGDFAKTLLNDSKPEGNFIFSPLNIYGALALVHMGASGTTKNELSNILGLPAEDNKLTEAHENLGRLLNDVQNTTYDLIKVNIANGIFIQKGLQLRDDYSRGLVNYYKSETQQLDFAKRGPEATNSVNEWVSDKTHQRIPKLFNDELSKNTVILLASALYFAGKWSDSFSTSDTETKSFNTGVNQVQVPTMRINESVPYIDNKDSKFQAISMPYLYGDFSMLIVLPYRDQSLKTLINSFIPQQFSEIIASFESTYVNYEIPRFKFCWSQNINQHLTKLGVKQMFEKAELDKMAVFKDQVAVPEVTHAAEIEVNEEGTVASAVTTVRLEGSSLPLPNPNPPIPFHADRPFMFSIYHRNTGMILFTGVVQNPKSENA